MCGSKVVEGERGRTEDGKESGPVVDVDNLPRVLQDAKGLLAHRDLHAGRHGHAAADLGHQVGEIRREGVVPSARRERLGVGFGADARHVAQLCYRVLDLQHLAVALGLLVQLVVLDRLLQLLDELVAFQPLFDACLDDLGLELLHVVGDVPRKSEMLAAFADADDGKLEWEVQERPDLLADGAVVATRRIVEIIQEEKHLRHVSCCSPPSHQVILPEPEQCTQPGTSLAHRYQISPSSCQPSSSHQSLLRR